MEEQSLPIVPFGKYKGQPITTLLNDTKYLEWCKQQAWFQKKFPIVYNICVNQTITTNNLHSKTPEHNKLQNLFLDNENVVKLLKIIFKKTPKNAQIVPGDIKFEGIFNWDLIVSNYEWFLCECDETKEIRDCDCEINKKFREKYNRFLSRDDIGVQFNTLCCEIKPCLGDDYPAVLRKMNTQIELTNNYVRKAERDLSYIHVLKSISRNPVYVLIIKDFNSTTTTKEQLITIFNNSRIKVVFIDDLFNHNKLHVNTNTTIEQTNMISSQEQKKIKTEEINSLRDNLLETQQKLLEEQEKNRQLEEKIRQLEEEIQLLKTKKQAKSINDYFEKK